MIIPISFWIEVSVPLFLLNFLKILADLFGGYFRFNSVGSSKVLSRLQKVEDWGV